MVTMSCCCQYVYMSAAAARRNHLCLSACVVALITFVCVCVSAGRRPATALGSSARQRCASSQSAARGLSGRGKYGWSGTREGTMSCCVCVDVLYVCVCGKFRARVCVFCVSFKSRHAHLNACSDG